MSDTSPAVTLVVGRSWDGTPLDPSGTTRLRLCYEGDALQIDVDAPYVGDPPPPGPAGATDKLWEHEVVELFAIGADQRYTEIELSPHGHHLVLRLEGPRNIVASKLPLAFTATLDAAAGRWRGTARIARSLLPDPVLHCNAFRVGGRGPDRRWEALVAVPGERPNFHQLDRTAPWPL